MGVCAKIPGAVQSTNTTKTNEADLRILRFSEAGSESDLSAPSAQVDPATPMDRRQQTKKLVVLSNLNNCSHCSEHNSTQSDAQFGFPFGKTLPSQIAYFHGLAA